MVRITSFAAVSALLAASTVVAQLKKECGPGYGKCPSNKPCCSQYGQCGIGAFCLGGCDPLNSNVKEACVNAPICESKTYKFTDSKSSPISPNTVYLGDSEKSDWVSDGTPIFANGVVYLSMAPNTVGTVLASTKYVWYGKISATMKTSRDQGVVTAFIMMSDVKDEIDYEWVGVDLSTSQTNYYWNGIPDYTHSGNISMSGDTFKEWHTYTIDWQPDSITWYVDGQKGRQKLKKDTWNSTSKKFEYPQTPSRVQLSLWPGGLKSNGQGTIDWAGGEIKWDGEDVKESGYYYAKVSEVTVECYDPPASAGSPNGKKSYKWNDLGQMENSIVFSNEDTVLSSLIGTGLNMTAQLPKQDIKPVTTVTTDAGGKATTIVSTAAPTGSDIETVPGQIGAGFGSGDLHSGGTDGNNGNTGTGSDDTDGNGDGTSTGSGSGSETTGFSQGGSGGGANSQSSAPRILAFGDKWLLWGNFMAIILVAATMATL